MEARFDDWILSGRGITLDLSYLGLTELPPLPEDVRSLNLNGNNLITLEGLPANLDYLVCKGNYLTELYDLPPYLRVLDCSDNPLVKIHTLPWYMEILTCGHTFLEDLPELPDSLRALLANGCDRLVLRRPLPSSIDVVAFYGTRYAKDETETMGEYIERLNTWLRCTEQLQTYRTELMLSAIAPHRVERWIEQGGFRLFDDMMGLS